MSDCRVPMPTMLQAFLEEKGSTMKQLDWNRAREICEEYRGHRVTAGLIEDWDWTCGEIFDGEKFQKDEYVYVSSRWATPGVLIDLGMEHHFIECSMEGDDPKMPKWWAEEEA